MRHGNSSRADRLSSAKAVHALEHEYCMNHRPKERTRMTICRDVHLGNSPWPWELLGVLGVLGN